MRRKICLSWVMLLMLLAAGCGQSSKLNLQAAECAEVLWERIPFTDTLSAIDEQMSMVLYPVDEKDVAAQQVYVSTGATAEEIAVFEAVDAAAVERLKEVVLQRLAEQKASYADYLPLELPKLEDPYQRVTGPYVIFCVSGHNEKVSKEVEQLLYGNEEG